MSEGPDPRGSLQRVGLNRHPRFLALREGESLGHDADDGGRVAVGSHGATDHLGVRAEVVRPRTIPEDEHRPRAWRRIGGKQRPPEKRLDAEGREAVPGHEGPAQPFGLPVAHDDVQTGEAGAGEAFERALGRAPVFVVVEADADLPLPGGRAADRDGHDAVAPGDGQAAQEDAVSDAEEQRRQGDAQGERDDGRGREAGLPDEHANRHPPVAEREHGRPPGRYRPEYLYWTRDGGRIPCGGPPVPPRFLASIYLAPSPPAGRP